MNKYPKALLLSAAAISPFAYSAGFQVSETTASGMGRANAGESARVDNAGVIAKNPAAAAYFDQQAFSGSLHYVDPDIDVEGTNTNPAPPALGGGSVDASAKDIAPSAVVPSFVYVTPINDQWAFGLTINSRFGLSTEYPNGYAASEYANESSIKSIYLTPSVSYKFNDAFSVGFGVSYITGEGKLKNTSSDTSYGAITAGMVDAGAPIPAAQAAAPAAGSTLVDLEADGDGFSWNLGMLWQINEDARIGFSYQSAVDLDTDADYTKYDLDASVASIFAGTPEAQYRERSGTLTLNLPDVIEVAYTQSLNEKWEISASIQHTGWSSFEEIAVDDDVLKEENWEDAMRYSLGADYMINDDVTIRFGYAFDESAVSEENRTLSIPDADRNWYSFGATFALPKGTLDAAFTYINGDNVEIREDDTGSVFEGELSKTDAYIYSVGYNVAF